VVDRRFNRRRHDAAQKIAAFSDRLREQVDLDALAAELLAVAEETMQPTQASLWLRQGPSTGSPLPWVHERTTKSRPSEWQTVPLLGRRRIGTGDLPITSRMLRVDLDGSRRIEPAHVGWPVGPDGSRRIQTDRLDDQSASDEESDGKAGNS
jgi:hypothetical protein